MNKYKITSYSSETKLIRRTIEANNYINYNSIKDDTNKESFTTRWGKTYKLEDIISKTGDKYDFLEILRDGLTSDSGNFIIKKIKKNNNDEYQWVFKDEYYNDPNKYKNIDISADEASTISKFNDPIAKVLESFPEANNSSFTQAIITNIGLIAFINTGDSYAIVYDIFEKDNNSFEDIIPDFIQLESNTIYNNPAAIHYFNIDSDGNFIPDLVLNYNNNQYIDLNCEKIRIDDDNIKDRSSVGGNYLFNIGTNNNTIKEIFLNYKPQWIISKLSKINISLYELKDSGLSKIEDEDTINMISNNPEESNTVFIDCNRINIAYIGISIKNDQTSSFRLEVK